MRKRAINCPLRLAGGDEEAAMPKIEWPQTAYVVLAILAAICSAGLFYAMGSSSANSANVSVGYSVRYGEALQDDVARACEGQPSTAFVECATAVITQNRGNQRDEHSLRAQSDAANWAFWAIFIAFFQLIATAIGLFYIRGTLVETRRAVNDTAAATNAMKEANEFSKEISAIELRPYLVVRPLGIHREAGKTEFRGVVEISNIGKTPANGVSSHIRMKEAGYDESDFPVGSFKDLASRTLLPGAVMIQASKNTLGFATIQSEWPSSLYVWGRVEYTDHEGNRRSTDFCHRYNKKTCRIDLDGDWTPSESATLIDGQLARLHIAGNDAT